MSDSTRAVQIGDVRSSDNAVWYGDHWVLPPLVPDAVVEAASAYMDGVIDFIGTPAGMRAAIREALLRASPHMLAGAWDEGVGYSWQHESPSTDENPYRSRQ